MKSFQQKLVLNICLDPNELDVTSELLHSYTQFNDQSDDILALTLAYTYLPSYKLLPNIYGQLYLLILARISIEQTGPVEWRVEGSYEYDQDTGKGGARPQEGEVALDYIKINFNIGGGSRKITQSLGITDSRIATGAGFDAWIAAVPPIDNAIGATEDEITGIEIPDSVLRVQITGYYLPDFIDLDFMNTLKSMVPTTNDDTFLGAEAGELLLTAVSGGGSIVDIIPITFDFLVAENLSAVSDPPFPSLTMKAHQYVEYVYLPAYDPTSKVLLRLPQIRHVHTIFKESDFTTLGLPE